MVESVEDLFSNYRVDGPTRCSENAMQSPKSVSQKRSQIYPDPLIIEPQARHASSFIILHGRSSNAEQFGPELIATQLPNGRTLKDELPEARFIFPTASFRRAKIFKRIPITQWFDIFSLEDTTLKQDLQVEGLRETSLFVHELLKREIDAVGARNVFLGGLSQGCAAALISLTVWEGPTLGGLFGMSGWLPMQNVLLSNLSSDEFAGEEHIRFESNDEINGVEDESLLRPLFEELQLDYVKTEELFKTSIFLGHGCRDEKVSVNLGRAAATSLGQMGCTVKWREYDELGHWYHGLELDDILDWIRQRNAIQSSLQDWAGLTIIDS